MIESSCIAEFAYEPLVEPINERDWRQFVVTSLHKSEVLREALRLASLGIPVFPIPAGQKHKTSANNIEQNLHSATCDDDQIRRWFAIDENSRPALNLGVALGTSLNLSEVQGVMALDLDRHHGKPDGPQLCRDFESKLGPLPDGPVQITPNNGMHRLFCVEPRLNYGPYSYRVGDDSMQLFTNTTVDGKAKFNRHIVVYPSVIRCDDGLYRQYRWRMHPADCRLPRLPEPHTNYLLAGKQSVPDLARERGNEEVCDVDLEPIIPLSQVSNMLASVSPDKLSYDEWLQIGLAVHSQHPIDGLAVWDSWSRNGQRYQVDECRKRWKGFKQFGSVRIGTLFWHAREAGWQPNGGDIQPTPSTVAIAELNQRYAYVVTGGKERIIRERVPSSAMDVHYDLLQVNAFKGLLVGRSIRDPGWSQPRSLAQLWLTSTSRRTYPNGLGLYPMTVVPEGVYNTWRGFSVEPIEGDCGLFLAHILKVICRGNDEHFQWLLNWLADLVQDPANPKGCAVCIKGLEGTGKGVFAETVGGLFGPHYIHLIDDKHLTGNFNAHLMDKVVVFADEITWGGNKRSAGQFKGLVTERWLTGERKGVDAETYRSCIHLIVVSNEDWFIPAGKESRRWFVLEASPEHANDSAYFDALFHQLDSGGREAFLHFILNRNLTPAAIRQLRKAPETKYLEAQREQSLQSRDKFNEWLLQLLDRGTIEQGWVVRHANHGMVLVKDYVYLDYKEFAKDAGGWPLEPNMFWTRWLQVFPWSRPAGDWPRAHTMRFVGGVKKRHHQRCALIQDRPAMYREFLSKCGLRGRIDEIDDADWDLPSLGETHE